MSLKTKVTMKRGWKSTEGLEKGVAEMAVDIHKRASILAPKDTRALVYSGKVTRDNPFQWTISFGSSRVPYARRRHYENKKNPQTLRYLERAADSVRRSDKTKYFKGKI